MAPEEASSLDAEDTLTTTMTNDEETPPHEAGETDEDPNFYAGENYAMFFTFKPPVKKTLGIWKSTQEPDFSVKINIPHDLAAYWRARGLQGTLRGWQNSLAQSASCIFRDEFALKRIDPDGSRQSYASQTARSVLTGSEPEATTGSSVWMVVTDKGQSEPRDRFQLWPLAPQPVQTSVRSTTEPAPLRDTITATSQQSDRSEQSDQAKPHQAKSQTFPRVKKNFRW